MTPLPSVPQPGMGVRMLMSLLVGWLEEPGKASWVSTHEHWQGITATGPHGLPTFATPNVGVVVIVISTPPERDNSGVGHIMTQQLDDVLVKARLQIDALARESPRGPIKMCAHISRMGPLVMKLPKQSHGPIILSKE